METHHPDWDAQRYMWEEYMKLGFIGLGTMGSHMAHNTLKAGFSVTVHDVRPETANAHLQQGARWADTPRQVAESSDVIFTSLPGPSEIESVALGREGLLHGMRAGNIYIDLSTTSPAMIRHIYSVFAEIGAHVLDAPVSGGPAGAESRNLAIWVGGDEDIYLKCKPILGSIGNMVSYLGPIGCGSIAKLVHNCAGFTVQCALAEVFTMGVKAGVDPLALWQAVRSGAQGRRGMFEGLMEHFLPAKFDPPDFALGLARKDIELAVNLGIEYNVPMKLSSLALDELTEAMNRGWGRRDSRVAMLLQEERSQIEIHVSEDAIKQTLNNVRDFASEGNKGH